MTRQFFVDETKQRDYQMVLAAAGTPEQVEDLRKLMRGQVLKGQRRVHMKKEDDSRRRAIAAAICGTGVTATVFDAGRSYRRELDSREACLRQIVAQLSGQPDLLVLEQDDSLLDWDRRLLYSVTRNAKVEGLRYKHRRAGTEALLAVPDAIAWCWAKGGDWAPDRACSPRRPGCLTRPGQREARLTNRPDGCRAHFHAATAAGEHKCTPRPRRPPSSSMTGSALVPGFVPETRRTGCCSLRRTGTLWWRTRWSGWVWRDRAGRAGSARSGLCPQRTGAPMVP